MEEFEIDMVDLSDEEIARYRAMTPGEKIQLVSKLNDEARARAAARPKREHAYWTEHEVLAEVARLMLSGDDEYFK